MSWPGCRLWRKMCAAWTAASAPRESPYPSWWGARSVSMAFITWFPAHLTAKRQRVQPMAIGLTLPSFLFNAMRVAPKKKCWTGWGSAAESLCCKGCFSHRAERVLLLTSTMVYLYEAKRVARLSPPPPASLPLELPRNSRGTLGTLLVDLPGTLWGGSGSASSLIIELTWDAKLLQWLPCLGTLKQRGAKWSRRSHDSLMLLDTTWSMIAANFLAEGLWEVRRILFKIFALDREGSNTGNQLPGLDSFGPGVEGLAGCVSRGIGCQQVHGCAPIQPWSWAWYRSKQHIGCRRDQSIGLVFSLGSDMRKHLQSCGHLESKPPSVFVAARGVIFSCCKLANLTCHPIFILLSHLHLWWKKQGECFHHPYIWQHFDAARLSELVCFHGLRIYCMCFMSKVFQLSTTHAQTFWIPMRPVANQSNPSAR